MRNLIIGCIMLVLFVVGCNEVNKPKQINLEKFEKAKVGISLAFANILMHSESKVDTVENNDHLALCQFLYRRPVQRQYSNCPGGVCPTNSNYSYSFPPARVIRPNYQIIEEKIVPEGEIIEAPKEEVTESTNASETGEISKETANETSGNNNSGSSASVSNNNSSGGGTFSSVIQKQATYSSGVSYGCFGSSGYVRNYGRSNSVFSYTPYSEEIEIVDVPEGYQLEPIPMQTNYRFFGDAAYERGPFGGIRRQGFIFGRPLYNLRNAFCR